MNRHDSGRFGAESLESAAKRYKTLGFSIIPLQGARNPRQPKLPAIKWARFQHTLPCDEELHSWFANELQAGIGIVCGRVSRLMVLDFDDGAVASEFRHLCPDLAQTFVVRSGTRRLPHFYYRLPEGKVIPTSAYQGVDLRGEGSYVVAPPTQVGEVAWTVEVNASIREVSDFDLRRIMRFLASHKTIPTMNQPDVVEAVSDQVVSEFRHLPTGDELIAYYHERCCRGRNHALFDTATMARDAGITEPAFCVMLAKIHAAEPGVEYEAYETRYGEAIRTIASAYSHVPRLSGKSVITGLGNAVREWLLSNEMACVARVVDGLYAVGMKALDVFTEAEACQRLAQLKIGRRSIMAALKANIGDFEVFAVTDTPRYPPAPANAAIGFKKLNNSCEMSRGAKRVKNGLKGRPARLYQLPSSEVIAAKIGVDAHNGDALTDGDFASAKTYRGALHQKLLERRPGYYARTWLAARLGVSRWTTRRYERALNIEVQPTYSEQVLSWAMASRLSTERVGLTRGMFIESHSGMRYPAVRGLALKLLKTGQAPVLKQQHGNYYAAKTVSVGIPTPVSLGLGEHNANEMQESDLVALGWSSRSVGIPTRQETGGWTNAQPHNASIPSRRSEAPDIQTSKMDGQQPGVGIPTPRQDNRIFWWCRECLNFHISEKRPEPCLRCGGTSSWEILSPSIWQDAQALKQWWQQKYHEHKTNKRERMVGAIGQPQAKLTTDEQALVNNIRTQVPDLSLGNARKLVRQFSSKMIEKALLVIRARGGLRVQPVF